MNEAFRRATSLTEVGDGRLGGAIDASWYQGRGAFGGLMAALTLEAMRSAVADDARRPRSLTIHFCAPAPEGPVSVVTEVLRAGTRVSAATARVERAGKAVTFATASFCRSRDDGARYLHARMPSVAPASELTPVPGDAPGTPAYFVHVEARFCGPILPFAGAERPEIAAWLRLREPVPHEASVAALLIDALPPAIFSTFTAPRPVSSVDFRVDFLERFPLAGVAPDEHMLVAITSRWADDGYVEELRDLWTPDGRLVAQCRQLLALL